MSNDDIALALILNDCRRPKKRSVWTRDHFMNREREGEFFNCFLPLYNGDDDEMFFNYMRMSKKSYTELRDLVNQDLKSEGNNFRKPISAEEKLSLIHI